MVQAIQVLRFHLLELEKVLPILDRAVYQPFDLFVIVKIIVLYRHVMISGLAGCLVV